MILFRYSKSLVVYRICFEHVAQPSVVVIMVVGPHNLPPHSSDHRLVVDSRDSITTKSAALWNWWLVCAFTGLPPLPGINFASSISSTFLSQLPNYYKSNHPLTHHPEGWLSNSRLEYKPNTGDIYPAISRTVEFSTWRPKKERKCVQGIQQPTVAVIRKLLWLSAEPGTSKDIL